jgi:hypothetical protein
VRLQGLVGKRVHDGGVDGDLVVGVVGEVLLSGGLEGEHFG